MRNVCRSLKGFLSLRQCFYHAPLAIQCKRSIWEYDLNAVEKATKYRVLCTHCSITNNILNIVVYYIIVRFDFYTHSQRSKNETYDQNDLHMCEKFINYWFKIVCYRFNSDNLYAFESILNLESILRTFAKLEYHSPCKP